MANPNRVPPTPFGRIFTGEAAAFLAARGGEAIFKVVPQQVIDTVVDILPAGILATPDRQKDFARYAKTFALLVFRGDVVKAEIVQEFLVESLEEIAKRKDDFENARRDDRKKSIVQDALNKHVAKLDKLRASVTTATQPGRNLWDTLAQLRAGKQAEFWTWFESMPIDERRKVLETGSGIVVAEERLLSFIDAPRGLKSELMQGLLDKSPRLGPSKNALERFLGDVRGKSEQYLEPDGREMQAFVTDANDRATKREDRVKKRDRMF